MRVRWTTDAADDLERICDYIATSRPGAAQNVAATIVRRSADLETFPQLGRQGRVEGTRELTFASLCHSSRFTKFMRRRCTFSEFFTARGNGHPLTTSAHHQL